MDHDLDRIEFGASVGFFQRCPNYLEGPRIAFQGLDDYSPHHEFSGRDLFARRAKRHLFLQKIVEKSGKALGPLRSAFRVSTLPLLELRSCGRAAIADLVIRLIPRSNWVLQPAAAGWCFQAFHLSLRTLGELFDCDLVKTCRVVLGSNHGRPGAVGMVERNVAAPATRKL
jgi:hypothetical protein